MNRRSTTIQNFHNYTAPSLERAESLLPKSFTIEVVNSKRWLISYPDHYCHDAQGAYTGGHLKYLDLLLEEA